MNMDMGVRLIYLIYGRNLDPGCVKNINHELIKASQLFSYLDQHGVTIRQFADAVAQGRINEKSTTVH